MKFFDDFFESDFSSMESVFKFLNSLKEDNLGNELNSDLTKSKPTEKTTYTEDGYTYEKTVWKSKNGKMVKLTMIGSPKEKELTSKDKLKQLKKDLEVAVENQEFETAIKLRDSIKELEKK